MLITCKFILNGAETKYFSFEMPTLPRVGDEINFEECKGVVERIQIYSKKPKVFSEARVFNYSVWVSPNWD